LTEREEEGKKVQYAGYIDGQFLIGDGETLIVENPSDGTEVARLAGLSLAQVESAILAARRTFNSGVWCHQPVKHRAQVMRRLIDEMAARAGATRQTLVSETGCPPHSGSMMAQLEIPLRMARECIDLFETLPELEDNVLPAAERVNRLGRTVQSLRCYRPLGVVVGIAAYNFPLHTAVWKVIPALIAGNSAIVA